MCQQIQGHLRTIIERQIDDFNRVPDVQTAASLPATVLRDLDRERAEHERFAADRAPEGIFVGREPEQARLLAYLTGDSDRPFVVHGVSGSGKTALLARAARDAARRDPVPPFPGNDATLLQRAVAVHGSLPGTAADLSARG